MFRKSVSLTVLLSFGLLLATSVVLYYEPHGRVAYWADWRLLGLGKAQWDALHISLGALFLFASLLHIWLNWKAVLRAMKNRARRLVVLTPPMVAALMVTLYFTLGALLGFPGVQQILDFSEDLKTSHVAEYGNPPYAHAELSTVREFADFLQLDSTHIVQSLREQGMNATPETTLLELARANNTSPRTIHEAMRSGLNADPFALLPARAPEGSGKMPLHAFCANYGLPLDRALQRLQAAGLEPDPNATLKALAEEHGMAPMTLYTILRTGERP